MRSYELMANAIRALSIDMVENANSGHQGAPLGFADVFCVLLKDFLKIDPCEPENNNRDRLILSNGHASAMLYAGFYLLGLNIAKDDLKNFRKIGGKLHGHPEIDQSIGVEMTTGMLGQGLASSVGFAIALKKKKIDSKVVVICSDGDLMEGVSHEAMSLAARLNLDNLIILFDDNDICIDGSASSYTTDNVKRFEAYGFDVIHSDGHDYEDIKGALRRAYSASAPTFVDFKTIIGKTSKLEGSNKCHGKFLSSQDILDLRNSYGFKEELFTIPEDVLDLWIEAASNKTLKKSRKPLESVVDIPQIIADVKKEFAQRDKDMATREYSGIVLERLCEKMPNLIGGSADLSESTNTINKHSTLITNDSFDGNFIHYGIREHAMGAIMNGLAIEGFRPYGGTFLSISDYMKPAIRQACIMSLPVIYVFTHDSIGLGEDGKTHQPIEQLSGLDAIPNLTLIRPACDMEVAESYEIALEMGAPVALALSRQKVIFCAKEYREENKTKFGAYEIYKTLDSDNNDDRITLIASGTEVSHCLMAIDTLEKSGFKVRVVSAPSLKLFDKQSDDYKNDIINSSRKIIIEAGSAMRWYKYKNPGDSIISIETFGNSGSCSDLYEHYGITADSIIAHAMA